MDFISFQTASAIGPSLKLSFVLLVTLDWGLLIPLYHSFGDREGVVQFKPPAHCLPTYNVCTWNQLNESMYTVEKMNVCSACTVSMLSLPDQRCPLMSEMARLGNVLSFHVWQCDDWVESQSVIKWICTWCCKWDNSLQIYAWLCVKTRPSQKETSSLGSTGAMNVGGEVKHGLLRQPLSWWLAWYKLLL